MFIHIGREIYKMHVSEIRWLITRVPLDGDVDAGSW